jgi:F420-dependent oxidoreductase-like protein
MEPLRVSMWAGAEHRSVDDVVAAVRLAADNGFDAVWVPQTLTIDTLTALAVAVREVPNIPVGTAVVPIQGRHPITLAQQALTVADAAGPGRMRLGIGVTHAVVSEGFYGVPYRGIVDLCEEHLDTLSQLFGPGHQAAHVGERITARTTLAPLAGPPELLVAALAPRMLSLAGRLADGTITWMTGAGVLENVVVPQLRAAAEAVGRAAPQVVAGLPVCVTADAARAREVVRPRIEGATRMPSYRRQVGGEHLGDVADLAIIGSADEVTERIAHLAQIGVTELMADVFGDPDERAATRALITS